VPPRYDILQDLIDGNIEQSKVLLKSLDRSKARYRDIGWLYVLRNPAFKDSLLKVGKTARFPTERAKELGGSTSVPQEFRLLHYVHVGDRHEAEKYVHRLLAPSRYREDREFFEAPLPRIADALEEASHRYPLIVTEGQQNNGLVVPQDYGETERVRCPSCNAKNKVRELYADIRFRCSECGQKLKS
jgi:hypothetical protein